MSVLTICDCVLRIKDQLGNAYSTAELTFEPRKSQINAADAVYINKIQRSIAAPGIVIQDLLYISKDPTVAPTVIYNSGGTAGSEVVSVTGSAITVTIQTGVSTATQIQTAIRASAAATALVYCLVSGTGSNTQTSFGSPITLSDDYCYLTLSETTTNDQESIFTLNWNDGNNYNSIIFDPALIPNQSFQDLSSILTVSRG